ncbi:MAG: hypothetical protein ABJN69_02810 [Hellea sp.]
MRRIELVNSVTKVINVFIETEVLEFLREVFHKTRVRSQSESKAKIDATVFFDMFSKLSIAYKNFTATEKLVVQLMDLQYLFEASFWGQISNIFFAETDTRRETIILLRRSVDALNFMSDQTPKILNLLGREAISDVSKRNGFTPKKSSIITIILPEDNTTSASPKRISMVMDGISGLYNVHAQLLGKEVDRLVVVACDSGSDKSFDFLGVAKVVEQMKETFFGVWDRLRLSKSEKFKAISDNFVQGLGVIEKIADLENEGKISNEEAQILKRTFSVSVQKLVDGGAIIPELNDVPTEEPRKLFRAAPKRLTAPEKKSKNKTNSKPKPDKKNKE